MTTATELITLALKDAGVLGIGQQAQAEDMQDGLTTLNQMLAQWRRQRWMVYHLKTVSFAATGALSYSVGTGQTINIQRPNAIESAFCRLNPSATTTVDTPLGIIMAREDYNLISTKNINSVPSALFYDADYPYGNLYIWPVPQSPYQIFITVKEDLASIANLTDTINLPPEYEAAIRYNLGVRFAPAYQLQLTPALVALAKDSLNVINMANAQVPTLQMPAFLDKANRFGYNIYTGQ